MGLQYDIDPSSSQVQVTGTGKVTMPEMIAVVDEIAEEPRFHSDYTVVFDLRDAQYRAELEDGNAFVALLERREESYQKRFALVVPESLHALGKLFILLAQMKGIDRVGCFTDLEEAREWLADHGG